LLFIFAQLSSARKGRETFLNSLSDDSLCLLEKKLSKEETLATKAFATRSRCTSSSSPLLLVSARDTYFNLIKETFIVGWKLLCKRLHKSVKSGKRKKGKYVHNSYRNL